VAIGLASAAGETKGRRDRADHVGFYLIDNGIPELERTTGVRRTAFDLLRRIGRHFPLFFYLGPIIFITVALSAELISRADGNRLSDWALGLIAIVLLICTSQLAVALVNWLATLLVTSRPLPKMDFSAGIPVESKTLVVVPSMIASPENVDHLA